MEIFLPLFIFLYLGLNVGIGWWASRWIKTSSDFAVAGRNLPLFLASSAMFATWFGSETMLGASSVFAEQGVIGIIEEPFGAALCLFLVGAFFARPLYRKNILTFNDYYRERYGAKVEFLSAIVMIPSYFGWIAAQLIAMSIILNVLIGVPLFWGIIICALVVVIYTYIGGMWAVSITDSIQTVVIVVGLLFFAVQMVHLVGGFDKIIASTPKGFFRFYPKADVHSIAEYIVAWITIGLGAIPQQDIFQRVAAAKSENTAVRASFLSSLMYIVVASLPLLIGLCGRILYPELLRENAQMLLPQIVIQHGSLFLQVMFFGALLSAIMSTASGAMLAPATVVGENLIKPRYPHLTDKQLLSVMRLSLVGIAISSGIMANLQSNIYELVALSATFGLVSLFVPLVAGLYWQRANQLGAICAMLAGMLCWIFFMVFPVGFPEQLLGLLASILGMILGSLLSNHPPISTKPS